MLKVMAGCINLTIHLNDYRSNDIQFYHNQAIEVLNTFHSDKRAFLETWLFDWGNLHGHYNLLRDGNSQYWTDLGTLLHYKYMILANLFSMGGLYTNVLFFNIIYFLGLLQFYKIFYQLQPQKKWLFVFTIFFIPSVLFWCSGIHKDGWVLTWLGLSSYFGFMFTKKKDWRSMLGLIFFLMLLLVSRYFIFLCFLAPMLLWLLLNDRRQKTIYFLTAYFLGILLFFSLGFFTPINPFEIIIAKQQAFFTLRGYSDINTPLLEPNLWSFIKNAPTAIHHILLEPVFDVSNPIKYQMASLDNLLILVLMIWMFFNLKRVHFSELIYSMLLVFAVSMYLFIGYTVPYCGALVRYKSEFTVLLLTSLAALSEVPFLRRIYVRPT